MTRRRRSGGGGWRNGRVAVSGAPARLRCGAARASEEGGALAFVVGLTSILAVLAPLDTRGETISGALALAYRANPDLNQQRAGTRADDELVSTAKSSFRPQVVGVGTFGPERTESQVTVGTLSLPLKATAFPRQASLVVTQNVFNGNRSANGVRQAESQVSSSREQLRESELSTLQSAATSYMNLLRDAAILELDRDNIIVLEEQLRQTRERFDVGAVTSTDVAQSEASLARARSDYYSARANLEVSTGNYGQTIGAVPARLEPAKPVDAMLPATLEEAMTIATAEHPLIQAALHQADAARLQVELNEGSLYPSLNVVGSVQAADDFLGLPKATLFAGSVMGQLSVPLYTGGAAYSSVRRAKELLSQARLRVDLERLSIRASVKSAWAQLKSARDAIKSARLGVRASEIALDGVRQEARVGQRTTVDVLQALQSLLQARITLVSVQRDRVVDTYVLLGAVGRLSAANLGLGVVEYDPTIHFVQVKDKWIGLRTPDGQ